MFDRVKILQKGDYFDKIPNYLQDCEEVISRYGNPYYKGYLKGLCVICKEGETCINGSWPKFKNGENITPLDIAAIKAVEEEISDLLHEDIGYWGITELETGISIFTDYLPQEYIKRLGDNKGYKEKTKHRNETLTFDSKYYDDKGNVKRFKSLSFYDKGLEATKNKRLPDEYIGQNILRCEFTVRGNLKSQLHTDRAVTPRLLSNPQFFQSMIDRLKQEYNNTDKLCFQESEIFKNVHDATGCRTATFKLLISLIGIDEYNRLVKYAEDRTCLDKRNLERYRAYMKSYITTTDGNIDPLVQELNSKINSL